MAIFVIFLPHDNFYECVSLIDVLFQCLVSIEISCYFTHEDGTLKSCDELRTSLSGECIREVELAYIVKNVDPDIDITILHMEGMNEMETNFAKLDPGESIIYLDEGEVNLCSITSRRIVFASVEAGNNDYIDPILCDDSADLFIHPSSQSPTSAPSPKPTHKPTTETPTQKPTHLTYTESPSLDTVLSSVPSTVLPTYLPSTFPTITPTTSSKPTTKATKSPKQPKAPRCKFGKTAKSGKKSSSSSGKGGGKGKAKGKGKLSVTSGKGKGGKGKGFSEGQVDNTHTHPQAGKGENHPSPSLSPHLTRHNSRRRVNSETTTLSRGTEKALSVDESHSRILREDKGILSQTKGDTKAPKNTVAPKASKQTSTKAPGTSDGLKKDTKAPSILDNTKFTRAPSISDSKRDTKAPSISPSSFPVIGNVTHSPTSNVLSHLDEIMGDTEKYCECEELINEKIEAPTDAPKENVEFAIEVFVPPNITIDESMEDYLLAALNYAFRLNLAACGMERSIDEDVYSLSFIEVTMLTSDELEESGE